jgi:5-methylcytosine-specific restriction endonuclease McrA
MMPVARKPAPTAPALDTCIEVYRKQAKAEPIETVWKRFRASACGKAWFDELQRAYGHRCLYCDHAEGSSIDHRDAKSTSVERALAWKNFRPSCLGCNHRKGTTVIVDPVSEDPRLFIQYDVTTGKPAPRSTATPARRKKATLTIRLLDCQTLNDARRAKQQKVERALAGFVLGEKGYDAAHVLAELTAQEPHRAIVRDLILDAEADLHLSSPLVRDAMQRLPTLKTWALQPAT